MGVVETCEPSDKGDWVVTLNRTGFYPEGGGQPSDTGTLGQVPVLYVWEKGDQVYHRVAGPLQTGQLVKGVIDWQRRYDHMPVSYTHLMLNCNCSGHMIRKREQKQAYKQA